MIAQPRLLCRYHYDPLDRIAGLATTSDAETRLFYQKSRLATQIQAGMQHSILQVDDHLLAQTSHSGKAAEIALLAADGLRSVVHVVGSGQHQAQAYTAYGYQAPTSGLHSLLGFAGERPDPVTGHYLLGNGYRAFNPVLMRFNSPDRLSPFGEGGVNAYAYCQGDPVNFNDSTGRMPLPFKALGKMRRSLSDARPMPAAAASSSASSSASPVFDLDDFMIDFDRFQQGTPALTPSNLLVSGGVTPPTAQTAVSSLPSSPGSSRRTPVKGKSSKRSPVRPLIDRVANMKRQETLSADLPAGRGRANQRYRALLQADKDTLGLMEYYRKKGGADLFRVEVYGDFHEEVKSSLRSFKEKYERKYGPSIPSRVLELK